MANLLKQKKISVSEYSNPYLICRLLVVGLSLAIMIKFGGRVSLWSDDLATISFVSPSIPFSEQIRQISLDAETNPPLFYILAWFWIRIVPYGTLWLKLLNILFVTLGIWFCGSMAKRIRGERAALIVTIFSGSSYFIINYAAFTFRCYGLFFMLSSLLLVSYHKRLCEPRKMRCHVAFGAVMCLMLYTHYYALIIFIAMGLHDLYLWLRKRIELRCVFSYIGAVVLFMPLVLFKLQSAIESHIEFWPARPEFKGLVTSVDLVFGDSSLQFLLFVAGITLALVLSMRANSKLEKYATQSILMMIIWVLFVIAVAYIYSRYVNPEGSIFVNRYFISIVAPALIVASVALDWLIEALSTEKSQSTALSAVVLTVVFIASYRGGINVVHDYPGVMRQPYEQAIDWIYSQDNALNKDTVVIMTGGYAYGKDYYGTHKYMRRNLLFGVVTEDNYRNYNTVYVSELHGLLSTATKQVLDQHYQEQYRNDTSRVIVYGKKPDE
jgi:uncharacterized membrane protein